MLTVVRGLIIVLLIFLHVGAQCITLTSEPDTNGSYCPGQVTFTCIGTNVANGLDWVLNGTVYNTFTLMRDDNNFPRLISERNNVSISIISASLVENSPGINLVSTFSVESLNPILNGYISCETLSRSSSQFLVAAKGNNDIIVYIS